MPTQVITSLSIILDLNPIVWGRKYLQSLQASSTLNISSFLDEVFVFLNAFLLKKPFNQVVIVGSLPDSSEILFPLAELQASSHSPKSNNDEIIKSKNEEEEEEVIIKKQPHKRKTASFFEETKSVSQIKKILFEKLISIIIEGENRPSNLSDNAATLTSKNLTKSSLSSALSLSLCYMTRLDKEKPIGVELHDRILIFSVSPDVTSQYISIMNCIFCAQKMNVMIDSCVLMDQDSPYLQQASYLTGGIYLRPRLSAAVSSTVEVGDILVRDHENVVDESKILLLYLMNVFLLDNEMRKVMAPVLPTQRSIDFRASCFQTRKNIDIGYVCSVCLSVFSVKVSQCSTCHTQFTSSV